MARARGISVKRITLFLFGGVSNIEREPNSPGTEFLISVVGPLTSLVLGVVFLTFGGLLARAPLATLADPAAAFSGLEPIATMLLWLGSINVMLGFFNLVPGFPLDGGRILRSILWAWTCDSFRSSRMTGW